MKGFIEVTDEYLNKKLLLPVNRICFIRERGDGCAVINFEMSVKVKECEPLTEKITDITTVETYDEVKARIAKAVQK